MQLKTILVLGTVAGLLPLLTGQTTVGSRTGQGAHDYSGATAFAVVKGTAAPAATDCDAAAEVGRLYVRSGDPATVNLTVSRCTQTGAASYAWHPVSHIAQATAPATCSIGEVFFDTDATAGSNWFGCTAANTWTAQGGSGSGAPTDASYGVLGTHASLSAERVITAGDNIELTDAGANSTLTWNTYWTPKSSMVLHDEFLTASTTFGDNRYWVVSNGTVGAVAGIANHPGIKSLATAATSASVANAEITHTDSAQGMTSLHDDTWRLVWIFKLGEVVQNKFRIGLCYECTLDPWSNGFYLEAVNTTGAANWFAVTRSAGVSTSTDTTVLADTAWHSLEIRAAASSITFYLDGTLRATHTTNLPPTQVSPGVFLVTTEAVAKFFQIDAFSMWLKLTR